jgi:hypothetical protein
MRSPVAFVALYLIVELRFLVSSESQAHSHDRQLWRFRLRNYRPPETTRSARKAIIARYHTQTAVDFS